MLRASRGVAAAWAQRSLALPRATPAAPPARHAVNAFPGAPASPHPPPSGRARDTGPEFNHVVQESVFAVFCAVR
jgi:hypothetical protein